LSGDGRKRVLFGISLENNVHNSKVPKEFSKDIPKRKRFPQSVVASC
jgi:hypothetical protein